MDREEIDREDINEVLRNALLENKLLLTGIDTDKIVKYLELVWEANKKLNLTGAKNINELIEEHFVDSLMLLKFYNPPPGKWCDLGSGAGFPGLPLKLVMEKNKMYLLEASRKKINFLKHAVNVLNLKEVEFLKGRAENVAREENCREKFDYLVARAVAEMPVLVETGLPLVKTGGLMFAYKGSRGEEEIKKAKNALEECGGKVIERHHYSISGRGKGVIYSIKKINNTPVKYPRREGIPRKKPL